MRTDLEGWEEYDKLVDGVIRAAIHWQDRHGHPRAPVLTLWDAASAKCTEGDGRRLACRYGDLNAATDGFESFSDLARTVQMLGPNGVLAWLGARAIVHDAKRKSAWQVYEKENHARWKSES